MKKIDYFGARRSGLIVSVVKLTREVNEPTAVAQGIYVPTSKKAGHVVPWGDVMVCLQKALAVSPVMRADLRTVLDELERAALADGAA